jgi:hypothetical protein
MAGSRFIENIRMVIPKDFNFICRRSSVTGKHLQRKKFQLLLSRNSVERRQVMKNMLIIISTILMSATVFAQGQTSYQCTMGELTRRVEIMHETGVTVPCEVQYYKDSEAPGERQVLWRAMNEEGFCESKTTEFIATLSGMGWNCGSGSMPVEAVESEEAAAEMMDDTDALAPVEAEDIELADPEADLG